MHVSVILLAAGAGARLGARIPKAFIPFRGRPLFWHSLRVFAGMREVREIVVVLPPGRLRWALRWYERDLVGPKPVKIVGGGGRRQDSVGCGLSVVDRVCDVILVHDAARPFVTAELARRVALAARGGAAVPAVAVKDTIKKVRGGRVAGTPDRRELVAVQTPQGIRADLLRRAYAGGWARKDATDDVQLVERMGKTVRVVEGSPLNLKITSREDLRVAEYMSTRR